MATANDLFDVIAKGKVKIAVNQTYALADAAQAQRDLEGAAHHGIDGAAGVSVRHRSPSDRRIFFLVIDKSP